MNNQELLDGLMHDKKVNAQYFDDIEEGKCINHKIQNSLSDYKRSVNKVMTMVNVTKILNLEIPCDSGYNSGNMVVLTNQGLRSRYISSNYNTQSSDLGLKEFARHFGTAMKIIFNHPDVSTVQKNKIMPLKTLDVKFLLDVSTNESIEVKAVRRIDTDLTVSCEDMQVPELNTERSYGMVKKFTLLSIREQVQPAINAFLKERRAMLEMITTKKRELEALFPIIFLFGDI